jgi:Acetylornithine deacetylase/Succinyl-diaminopimelate desuccinylase and related deacylases
LPGEAGYGSLERRWFRPTFDVNGIWGGYMGEGSKTVIPSVAFAKFSMRLVANQNPDRVMKLVTQFLEQAAPPESQLIIRWFHGAFPVNTDIRHPVCQAAAEAISDVWGKPPVFQGEGGSVPIVTKLKQILGVEALLIGFNLPFDRIHAPNEQFGVENYIRGIKTCLSFYQRFAQSR